MISRTGSHLPRWPEQFVVKIAVDAAAVKKGHYIGVVFAVQVEG